MTATAWLKTESKKSRKQKRTMKQLHPDLVSLGYEGSYCRVAIADGHNLFALLPFAAGARRRQRPKIRLSLLQSFVRSPRAMGKGQRIVRSLMRKKHPADPRLLQGGELSMLG